MKKSLVFLLFLSGCTTVTSSNRTQYWDIPGFIEEQQQLLASQQNAWQKTVVIDQHKEQKERSDIPWEKELALFRETDLNKTAYQGNVQVLEQGDSSVFIITDPELPIQRVFIQWDKQHKPVHLAIESASDNMLYATKKELTAHFQAGELVRYQIKTQQKVQGLSASQVWVEGIKKGS